MGNTINTNMMSLNIANMYNTNTKRLEKSMYAMATGKTINNAGDDPTGMGQVQRLTKSISSEEQATKNLQNDSSIIKLADDALSNMAEVITSIRDKVVSAANSSTTSTERSKLGADISELMSRFDDIAQDVKYGGNKFFDSTDTYGFANKGFFVQWGENSGENFSMKFAHLKASAVGLKASTIVASITKTSATGSSISKVLTKVDNALNSVISQHAKVGSYEQRLGYLEDNSVNRTTVFTQLRSSIQDTDTAKGMAEFMANNIRTQASQLMLAQAGQLPSMVLQLLQS